MALKIDCADIHQGIVLGIKHIPDDNTRIAATNIWKSLSNGGTTCVSKDDYSSPCNLLTTVLKSKKQNQSVVDLAQKVCERLLTSCKDEFCEGKSKSATFDITCKEMKIVLSAIVGNSSNICTKIQALVGTKTIKQAIEDIIELLKEKLKKEVKNTKDLDSIDKYIDKYKPQIQGILVCICPKLHDGSTSVIPDDPCAKSKQQSNVQVDSVNFKALSIFVLLLLAIFIIPIVIIAFHGSWSPCKRVVIILVMLGFAALLTGGLLVYNPANIIRTKILTSDDWKAIDGNYRGQSETIAGIQVTTDLTVKGNKIQINKLTCSGSCPDNLIKTCHNTELTVNTSSKSDLGYPLCGDCLTKMESLIRNDNTKLRGIYMVRKGDDYYVQIALKINVLEPLIQVKLQKY